MKSKAIISLWLAVLLSILVDVYHQNSSWGKISVALIDKKNVSGN